MRVPIDLKEYMMKRHYYIIKGIVLLAATLLAACNSSDSDDSPVATSQNEIRITTNVTSMPSGTRATTIDNNNALQDYDLKIDAYFNGTETKFLDGKTLRYDSSWKFWNIGTSSQEHYYWPIEGSVYDPASSNINVSSLDFVGFCPYAKPGYISAGPTYNHTDGISFTADMASYMTNTAQADVSEFLVGLTQNQTYSTQTASNGVPLNFKHPFARIMYKLAEDHPDITIHSITLKNLKTGGSYTLSPSNAPSWTSLSGSTDLVTNLTGAAAIFNNNTTEKPIGSQLIVIPQDFAGTIEISAEQNGDTETLSTTLSSTTWQAGYSYTYTFTINFPQKELIVNTTKYTEQW